VRRESETALNGVRLTGRFDPCAHGVTPEGFGCYFEDQNAIAVPAGRPRQKARLAARVGRAMESRGRGANGPRQSSPISLSHAGIWRPVGCRLPDAILHGKRNCGLIAGPSNPLRSVGF